MRVQPAYLRGSHHIYLKGRQPGDLLTCGSREKHRCNSVAEVIAGMNSIQARQFGGPDGAWAGSVTRLTVKTGEGKISLASLHKETCNNFSLFLSLSGLRGSKTPSPPPSWFLESLAHDKGPCPTTATFISQLFRR